MIKHFFNIKNTSNSLDTNTEQVKEKLTEINGYVVDDFLYTNTNIDNVVTKLKRIIKG